MKAKIGTIFLSSVLLTSVANAEWGLKPDNVYLKGSIHNTNSYSPAGSTTGFGVSVGYNTIRNGNRFNSIQYTYSNLGSAKFSTDNIADIPYKASATSHGLETFSHYLFTDNISGFLGLGIMSTQVKYNGLGFTDKSNSLTWSYGADYLINQEIKTGLKYTNYRVQSLTDITLYGEYRF